MPSVVAVAALAPLAACAPRVTQIGDPAGAHRFEIVAVGDSTFSFLATGLPWVRAGDTGISVDPRRRDALIAQFVVQRRAGDTVTALVTGQTSRVVTTYVALLTPPTVRALRQRNFWIGVFAGGAIGAATAVLAR